MAAARERQDSGDMVEVRTWLPRRTLEELDRRAAAEGMRRSTFLRVMALRVLREGGTPK